MSYIMKKVASFIALILLLALAIHAQKGPAPAFEVGVGGTFAKPKIIPALDKLGLAQVVVRYNLTTMTRTVGQEKSTGQVAGAKLAAFLETTDGKLTDADFQEITDHFYTYFQKKLQAAGIDTVAWSAIASKDFYQNGADKQVEASGASGGNVWATSSAHQGNVLYGGSTAFAFGKIKKASNFCEEIGAPAAFFNLTVDFADVMLDVDIKTNTSGGLYNIPKSRTWKYNSAVNPQIKVIPNTLSHFTLFWNEKSQAENLLLKKDIDANVAYTDNVSQDQARMKNSLWAFSKEMNPVVIETTRAKYKAAAQKALENYADEFIKTYKELKKA
jgi:hypothetical protein